MHRGEYPPNWTDLAIAAKRRAQFHCENCGHQSHMSDWENRQILTVHHLDLDKSNCHPSNLIVTCQRCHLSIQARFRPGQLHLPHIEPPRWYHRTQTFQDKGTLPEIDDAPW